MFVVRGMVDRVDLRNFIEFFFIYLDINVFVRRFVSVNYWYFCFWFCFEMMVYLRSIREINFEFFIF